MVLTSSSARLAEQGAPRSFCPEPQSPRKSLEAQADPALLLFRQRDQEPEEKRGRIQNPTAVSVRPGPPLPGPRHRDLLSAIWAVCPEAPVSLLFSGCEQTFQGQVWGVAYQVQDPSRCSRGCGGAGLGLRIQGS